MLPPYVRSALATSSLVGVSGSRRLSSVQHQALRLLPPWVQAPIITGCASGVDAWARRRWPAASVIHAAAFGAGKAAFARRSIYVVQAVASVSGLWVSLPGRSCPEGLAPSRSASRCFSGRGSGSWASLALAQGLGCTALVFMAPPQQPPKVFGLQSLGNGWWWYAPPVQALLF